MKFSRLSVFYALALAQAESITVTYTGSKNGNVYTGTVTTTFDPSETTSNLSSGETTTFTWTNTKGSKVISGVVTTTGDEVASSNSLSGSDLTTITTTVSGSKNGEKYTGALTKTEKAPSLTSSSSSSFAGAGVITPRHFGLVLGAAALLL